ncbi:uncharacterized protein CcaverHIS019_0109920 [Cutaneotrichosporon cavernicola]|uniref:G-patch domain-containing protein n=1 Tax=Cutaneotrichosporon cavernicola TaxID=279322 RepID=A0AA48I2A9_9TREE|nr:uncharacterized protein CcaverHIS019_0109920 [Cutaneotrichosporon cavernicola]BEI88274.1 hypothetical protein CcaverHIS019_0109920 [Cutaneotrichosporon cavernicola]BEI96046.1 hypothetical protein CcaverHIS631_0109950 [Cutaneotrichosporon cavernicola]BEJ03818.1 hypothetical protein CcaverHIS641_0109930 [Cutaneotrichosporon cavernicola]
MTSRLKHKLELENVNLKSAYLNESFVKIGTPLPALSEHKKDKQEFLPAWEQEVRDEKGRRRFHGAFTGGWSAGYFNSVGSKEGWTPSTFKSSRSNRSNYQQSADDFMDEEDRQQMNEDRQLQNTETFQHDAFAGERELGDKSLSSALESLVVPAKSSIGHSILQKLGWRPGQGIGPRVTLRKLRIQQGKLGRVRAGLETETDDSTEASKHMYAPRDTTLLVYGAKDDKEGLGYQKGRGMGAIPRKRPTWGAGEDDDDPYSADATDQTHYVFDNEDVGDETIVLGQPGAPESGGDEARSGSNTARWHDGRPVLTGFVLDPKGVPKETWWAFPDIASDWKPSPTTVWDAAKKSDEQPLQGTVNGETPRGAPGRLLSHAQRGEALGEEPRVSAAKSVWEYISEKDRERLQAFAAAAKSKAVPLPSLSMAPEPELPPERATDVVIPPLSPRTASAALQGFMPYTDDGQKQERYRSYLRSQTYNTKSPFPTLLPSASVDDINQELETFAQSARIFRPMSYALSSRFASGSTSLSNSDSKVPRPGLHLYDPSKAAVEFAKPQHTEVEVKQNLTPREQAAHDGDYGPLTRVVKNFYPVKLVCRRFHVTDPHPDGPPEGEKSGTATPTTFQSVEPMSFESQFTHQAGTEVENDVPMPTSREDGEHVPTSLAEVGMADDANQGRDILTYTKPSIDIFKAIFASDDEDEDEDEPTSKAVAVVDEKPKDPFPVDEGPLDYNTFKPVFRRAGDDKKDDEGKRKKDKKKKRKGVLSFDVGDDGDEGISVKPKKKSKPSRRDDDAGVWVEKVAPGQQPEPAPTPLSAARGGATSAPPGQQEAAARNPSPMRGGRKGAADFM